MAKPKSVFKELKEKKKLEKFGFQKKEFEGLKKLRQLEFERKYKSKVNRLRNLEARQSFIGKATDALASTQRRLRFTDGIRTGRRGRPKGSYDPRYAAVGGVYAARKILAQQLRERRLNAIRRATVSPEQERILRNIQSREAARRQNPENQVIPDTDGNTSSGSFEDEINRAAGLVP